MTKVVLVCATVDIWDSSMSGQDFKQFVSNISSCGSSSRGRAQHTPDQHEDMRNSAKGVLVVLAGSLLEESHPTFYLIEVDVVRRVCTAASTAGVGPLLRRAMFDKVVGLFLQHESHNLQKDAT